MCLMNVCDPFSLMKRTSFFDYLLTLLKQLVILTETWSNETFDNTDVKLFGQFDFLSTRDNLDGFCGSVGILKRVFFTKKVVQLSWRMSLTSAVQLTFTPLKGSSYLYKSTYFPNPVDMHQVQKNLLPAFNTRYPASQCTPVTK